MRIPPGRAGRLWLIRHRDLARRATDMLERKQRLLREESRRRTSRIDALRSEWERASAEMQTWMTRGLLAAGHHRVAAMGAAAEAATLTLCSEKVLGVELPAGVVAAVPAENLRRAAALGGSAAFDEAARASQRAVLAGVAVAEAEAAGRCLDAALATTSQRLRLLSRHRLPELEAALRSAEERLADQERADLVQMRWAARRHAALGRRQGSGGGS